MSSHAILELQQGKDHEQCVSNLHTSIKQLLDPFSPNMCELFILLTIRDWEDVLTMIKYLRAGCQACRQNCKEIQSQNVEVDGHSFRMRYCHSASSWQVELHTNQGRQEHTVSYACLHKITAWNSLQMLLTSSCRCPGRNSVAGIDFHPEENVASPAAEARQNVYIREHTESQLSV